MNKYYKISFVIFITALVTTPVLAQSFLEDDNSLDVIRSQFLSADEKYEKLQAENNQLKAQLKSLQNEVSLSQGEVRELKIKFPHRVKADYEQSPIDSEVASKLSANDPYIDEAQELYLSGQVLDLSDEQKLRELHLYDLQHRKQELQLDLKELEILYSEDAGGRKGELDALEDEIQEIVEEEKELRNQIAELEKISLSYPQEIDLLKVENKNLKNKIIRLKK